MGIKLLQIVNSISVLNKISNSDKLPIKQAYMLAKFIPKVQKELETFESLRIKLLEKYGEKREDGQIQVKENNLEEFQQEISKLLDVEINFDSPKLALSDLDKIGLSVIDLMTIDYLIESEQAI
ncbi:Hypothetical protein IALB_0071 [Ignavibacterium album JCM 16511]|uniref:Uncharacterized protein n=1 Tax=Ignavibacterium album (strain DSM 19864 / JCM 16511 / NBRC 101810 / Mat9-16) TaxID=945713 RepID=I0AFM8_IGNAJ|nr:hypothetical protein [Ignavibacterium album]AFH47785.1 Hypothetical protein IALB_0071 [Ignavibacterium album JCM 16511]